MQTWPLPARETDFAAGGNRFNFIIDGLLIRFANTQGRRGPELI